MGIKDAYQRGIWKAELDSFLEERVVVGETIYLPFEALREGAERIAPGEGICERAAFNFGYSCMWARLLGSGSLI